MDKDNYRIIKINKEALWEYIYESFIDHLEDFFNVEPTEVTSHFDRDCSTGEFICLVRKSCDENKEIIPAPKSLDLKKLLKHMKPTTDTLYQSDRYTELTLDEIIQIQSKGQSKDTQ